MDKLSDIALQPYLDGKHGVILQGEAIRVLTNRAQEPAHPWEVYRPKCRFCGGEVRLFEDDCSASCREIDDE